jgi:hypothetical protein
MNLKYIKISVRFIILIHFFIPWEDEQRFIYTRLDLLDRNYCLVVDLQLWQSYFNIGLEQHRWPVSILSTRKNWFLIIFLTITQKEQLSMLAKTNDLELCQQYLTHYIEDMKKQIDQYELKLTKQSALCPIKFISLDQIDYCLKEFVDCQRNYLTIRNNNQLAKFQEKNEEKELFEIITAYYPTLDQVSEKTRRVLFDILIYTSFHRIYSSIN